MQNLLTSVRLFAGQLATLLVKPTSNLRAALFLYGIIALAGAILVLLTIMAINSRAEDEEYDEDDEAFAGQDEDRDEDYEYEDRFGEPLQPVLPARPEGAEAPVVEPKAPKAPLTPRRRALRVLLLVGVAAVVWVLAGYSTSAVPVCTSCHAHTSHLAAQKSSDPHAAVACVSCHEPGGWLGRYATNVSSRILHFVDGSIGISLEQGYGPVTSAACSSCHASGIAKATTDAARGVRMSHKEPLAAGADCVDCHALQAGVVSSRTVGMGPCLRCHDAKIASAECTSCHDKKASAAARALEVRPAVQVPDVRCDGCHDTKKECDTCHGTPMPHTAVFMAHAHARAGAVDLYYNGGRTCGKCHTATRRPCGRCHTPLLGHGHPPNNLATHAKATAAACNTCHQQWAYSRQRDFCKDLCHTPDAIAASPR